MVGAHRSWACALALAACGDDRGGALLGTLERDRIELVAEAQEPITRVAVREGEAVKAGAAPAAARSGARPTRAWSRRARNETQAERRHAENRGRRAQGAGRAGARRSSPARRRARPRVEGVTTASRSSSTSKLLPASALDRQRAAQGQRDRGRARGARPARGTRQRHARRGRRAGGRGARRRARPGRRA